MSGSRVGAATERSSACMLRDLLINKDGWYSMIPGACQCGYPEILNRINHARRRIDKAVVFEISNVAEYLYLGTQQEVWDIFADFPRPRPPFESTWMEWKIPGTTWSEGEVHDLPLSGMYKKAGCLIEAMDGESMKGFAPAHMRSSLKDFHIKTAILISVFLERKDGYPSIVAAYGFALNQEWRVVGINPQRPDELSYLFPEAINDDIPRELEENLVVIGKLGSSVSFPAMLAMGLLNCKNVTTTKVATDRALIKANMRRGKHVTPSHLIIEIRPLTEKIKHMSGSAGYTRAAASIVRGHFKDYTAGKGLFGRSKGLFWWDQRLSVPPQTAEYRFKNATGGLDKNWVGSQPEPELKPE